VEGEDLFLWRHRATGLSQPVHALGPFAPVNNVPVPLGLDQEIACIWQRPLCVGRLANVGAADESAVRRVI
jgi:hypothetical protein